MQSNSTSNQSDSDKSNKLIYWAGVHGKPDVLALVKETLATLLASSGKSLNFEKLRGNGRTKIYSARIIDAIDGVINSRSNRLIFTTEQINGEEYIVVLGIVINHEYDKCPALKRNFLAQYGYNLADNTTISAQDFEASDEGAALTSALTKANVNPRAAYASQRKFIILDDEQEATMQVPLPALIIGGPGTGKTLLGNLLMLQQSNQRDVKIAYITYSTQLCERAQQEWLNTNADCGLTTPDFFTCAALAKLRLGTTEWPCVGASDFDMWFAEFLENTGKRLKPKGKSKVSAPSTESEQETLEVLDHPQDIYHELMLISGLSDAEYKTQGARRSIFTSETQRDLIIEIREAYLASLRPRKKIDSQLQALPALKRRKYDFIVVDEAQLLSRQFLIYCAQMAKQGSSIVFLMDPNQHNARIQIDTALCEALPNLTVKPLTGGSKRCPVDIAELATVVLKLKNQIAGGVSSSYENVILESDVTANDVKLSHCNLAQSSTLAKHIETEGMNKSTQFVVITAAEYREEAKTLFHTPNVLTPAEVRGLEFKGAVIYKLCSSEIYHEIRKQLAPKSAQSSINVHRPKQGQGNDKYNAALNDIYVALTRVTNEVIICDDGGITLHLAQAIDAINARKTQTATTATTEPAYAKSSANDWQELKKVYLADGINAPAAAIDSFLQGNNATATTTTPGAEKIPTSKSAQPVSTDRKAAASKSNTDQTPENATDKAAPTENKGCKFVLGLLKQFADYIVFLQLVRNKKNDPACTKRYKDIRSALTKNLTNLFTSKTCKSLFLSHHVTHNNKLGNLFSHLINDEEYTKILFLYILHLAQEGEVEKSFAYLKTMVNILLPPDNPSSGPLFKMVSTLTNVDPLEATNEFPWPIKALKLILEIHHQINTKLKIQNSFELLANSQLLLEINGLEYKNLPCSILHFLIIKFAHLSSTVIRPNKLADESILTDLFKPYGRDRIYAAVIYFCKNPCHLANIIQNKPALLRKYLTEELLLSNCSESSINAYDSIITFSGNVLGHLLDSAFLALDPNFNSKTMRKLTTQEHRCILDFFFTPTLIEKLTIDDLFATLTLSAVEEKSLIPVEETTYLLHHLVREEGAMNYLLKILKEKSHFISNTKLFDSIKSLRNSYSSDCFGISNLVRFPCGREILQLFLQRNPEIASLITEAEIKRNVYTSDKAQMNQDCISYLITIGETDLVNLLRSKCPQLVSHIDTTYRLKNFYSIAMNSQITLHSSWQRNPNLPATSGDNNNKTDAMPKHPTK